MTFSAASADYPWVSLCNKPPTSCFSSKILAAKVFFAPEE